MGNSYHDLVGAKLLGCHKKTAANAIYWHRQANYREISEVTMVYIAQGGIKFVFENRYILAHKGDLVFLDTGKLLERIPVPGKPISYYYAQFIPIGPKGQLPFKDTGLPEVSVVSNTKMVVKWLEELFALYLSKEPGWHQASSIRLLHIFETLAPEQDRESVPTEGPDDRNTEKRIGDVLKYISDNYKKRLSIKELADVAKMHPVHLNRLFHKVTGIAPHQYVLDKKILKAKDFLLHFNESLTTTAIELGFHDYSHFARAFRKITGITPRDYVNKIKAKRPPI
ncbi:MAG: helix-turn-helix transcriptional regulator [Fibrobacteres bacterium]|nr:helix-turn-helix transcriptional regulator [Fibrobacterota bacterium]